jgi:hypothetical protein
MLGAALIMGAAYLPNTPARGNAQDGSVTQSPGDQQSAMLTAGSSMIRRPLSPSILLESD